MTAVVLFFAVGILLLVVEVVAPGGVLGVFGGISLIAGSGLAFAEFGLDGGLLATGIAALIAGLVLYGEFVLLPKTRFARKLAMATTLTGQSQPKLAEAAEIVGREGEAVTRLSPSGYVVVDGKRYEAFCRLGQLEERTAVRVVGVDNFRLIVTPSSEVS